jgi:hypothetical protein
MPIEQAANANAIDKLPVRQWKYAVMCKPTTYITTYPPKIVMFSVQKHFTSDQIVTTGTSLRVANQRVDSIRARQWRLLAIMLKVVLWRISTGKQSAHKLHRTGCT